MNLSFQSEAGQDEFVYKCLNGKRNGTFVDIGSGPPKACSNSWVFETIGWNGLCVDRHDYDYSERSSRFERTDCLAVNYLSLFKQVGFPYVIDYLSLDVDDSSFDCLNILPHGDHIFRVITIEHDHYRLGDSLRSKQRELLSWHGYTLQFPDVFPPSMGKEKSFEDWWVHSDLLP